MPATLRRLRNGINGPRIKVWLERSIIWVCCTTTAAACRRTIVQRHRGSGRLRIKALPKHKPCLPSCITAAAASPRKMDKCCFGLVKLRSRVMPPRKTTWEIVTRMVEVSNRITRRRLVGMEGCQSGKRDRTFQPWIALFRWKGHDAGLHGSLLDRHRGGSNLPTPATPPCRATAPPEPSFG